MNGSIPAPRSNARAPPGLERGFPSTNFEPEMRLTVRRISAFLKEANMIDEHRKVMGSHQISIRAADLLEDM